MLQYRPLRTAAALAAACLLSVLALPLTSALAAGRAGAENRCGYLANPTPANWWLNDKDGEWIISVQGGYQARGLDRLPESFFDEGWEKTNGWYGFRCACLSVSTDRKTMRITRIYSGKALPMQTCQDDKTIRHAE